jgi:LacI family transcriptional regulator
MEGSEAMAIKIKEIAQKANVSVATVSMALNNKPGISKETKAKIMQIAEEHGYSTPLIKNDSLKNKGNLQLTIYKKHSKVIGDTPFFQSLIEGIESKARHNGYNLIIKYVSEKTLQIAEFQQGLKEKEIDAMLILATEIDERVLRRFLEMGLPVVVIDAYFAGLPAEYVVINNASGAYLATRHLLDMGHSNIGYLKSAYPIQNFNERFEGFRKALIEAGLPVIDAHVVSLGSSMESAYEDMALYLEAKPALPTAFFADNDLIALGAMKALKEKKYRVPDDVSVIGFDDMPFSSMAEPALTTVSVDKKIFGKLAVERILEFMDVRRSYFLKTTLDTELIIRNSVKKTSFYTGSC